MADMVRHPAHYGGEDDPYEVIKVAEAWGFDTDAYLFNVLKYIRRDKADQLEDLKKARFYLERKIKRLESEPVVTPLPRRSRMLEIILDPADPAAFRRYAVNAHPDWSVSTLASIVAAGAKRTKTGAYGIAVNPDAKRFKGTQSVRWMLEGWPPEQYSYYLMEPEV